ncbi:Tfp pilus assembly protein PilV [Legionella beliardensis]|uniref:Tfp pilus assembly protein PilV n=1 Tax=Legionella beliardensis TaxID=91822 RepID=A0A378HZV5_9GAMM|nr:prepilin-type N-terminal cleavage/methylation domain-containing protein [Legionella beliardensis]STX28262.1 Tfp pilus assembly protein PilV [Legionella beliardensis]
MQRGFSLIEVLISLFIMSTTVLSLLNQQLHSYLVSHQLVIHGDSLNKVINLKEQCMAEALLH